MKDENTRYLDAILLDSVLVQDVILNLEKTALRATLIVDGHMNYLGIITDGDIRRGFMRGIQIDSPASEIMNSHSIIVDPNDSLEKVKNLFEMHKIQHIPIIDSEKKIKGMHIEKATIGRSGKQNKVLIMAGGVGIRMRPLTEVCPKPMIQLGSKPILEHVILRFKEQGFSKFKI